MTDRIRVCTIWKISIAKLIRNTPDRNADFPIAPFRGLAMPRASLACEARVLAQDSSAAE